VVETFCVFCAFCGEYNSRRGKLRSVMADGRREIGMENIIGRHYDCAETTPVYKGRKVAMQKRQSL
jgi:hypothetical protein